MSLPLTYKNIRNRSILLRILYRGILDISYVLAISEYWSYYMNLTLNVSFFRLILSYFITSVVAFCTPILKKDLVTFFLNIQLYIMLIPMCSLYGLSDRSLVYLFGVSSCHCMQCLLISKKIQIHLERKICLRGNIPLLILFLIALLFITVMNLIRVNGFPTLEAFNLYQVYDVRNKVSTIRGVMGYLIPWCAKVVMPFLLVFFLNRKRVVASLLIIISQLYFYTVFAQKTFLFTPFLATFVYICVKKGLLDWCIERGISLLVFSVTAMFLINKNWIMPISLLVRRVLFVPATIKFAYYDFFSVNSKVHFADGTLGHILKIQSPYELQIPKIISEYLGRPSSNCNAGYLGDAYANGGWIGVFAMSILIIIFVKILDKLGSNMDKAVLIASCLYLFYSLNDSALLTTLLTGGGILLLFIYVISSMKYENDQHYKKI